MAAPRHPSHRATRIRGSRPAEPPHGPLPPAVTGLAGGNLGIVEAPRRGRDAADDHIADLADAHLDGRPEVELVELTVVTSDKGLRARLPVAVTESPSGRGSRISSPA